MPHRLPASPNHGPTPGLSQHSGPPSVQANQKPLLKGPKAARHQDRKGEVPGTSAPWKDPREVAAASAGHKRSLKDGVLSRQSQSMGPPPPPSDRPTRRKEGVTARRQAAMKDLDPVEQDRAWFRESVSQLDLVEEGLKDQQQLMQKLSADVDSISRMLDRRGL